MNKIIFALLLLFTVPVFAASVIEQQVKESPQILTLCEKKIAYYTAKVGKYEGEHGPRRFTDSIKLGYYRAELQTWNEYCNPAEEE